jgi:presenilin-like A22 family membrane protease
VSTATSPLSDPRVRGVVGTGALFLAVQLLALVVTPRLAGRGVNYGNGGGAALVPLVLGLGLGTLLALAVTRWGVSPNFLRGLTILSLGVSVWFVGTAFLGPVGGVVPAALAVVAITRSRRLGVRNVVAAVAVAGAAGVFGASLAPRYAVLALLLVAVYDAYSVYYSGHMVELADTSLQLDLPNAFVVSGGATDADDITVAPETTETDGPRATLLGAGDALFPALLAASAQSHTATVQVGGGLPLGVAPTAVGAVVGGLVGFLLLQTVVQRRGGVHAGLPPINAGAVVGWLFAGGLTVL